MNRTLLGLAIASLLVGSRASGQATRLVDPLDPAYQDLKLLAAHSLIDQASISQLPLSRREFGRLLDSATVRLARRRATNADGAPPAFAINPLLDDILSSLRERFGLDRRGADGSKLATQVAPIRTLSVDLTDTDQPTRLVPKENGIGAIDARLNSLLIFRHGQPLGTGANAILATTHSFESERLAVAVTPELIDVARFGGGRYADIRLQELQLRFLLRNLAVDIGREYLLWGEGRDVGLLNSNNSPPFDLVKLSSESAFYFPWLFRLLGPSRFSFFFATLGGDQNYPHSYAVAYRLNSAPQPWLELGFSVHTKSGGEGAPRASTTARLIDLLPFLDASAYNNIIGTRGNFQFSDHYAGFNGRLRSSKLGASIFWEVLLNDFDVRRLESVLWEDAGHVFGFDFANVAAGGRFGASAEYHHTGIRYYEHHQFTSGQTLHHSLTGDPLGPDAQGLYGNIDLYLTARKRVGVQLGVERRSNDQYVNLAEPNFGFARVEVRPKEWTGRASLRWQALPERSAWGALLELGYARTHNFDFLRGDNRNGFLGRAALEYRFQ